MSGVTWKLRGLMEANQRELWTLGAEEAALLWGFAVRDVHRDRDVRVLGVHSGPTQSMGPAKGCQTGF